MPSPTDQLQPPSARPVISARYIGLSLLVAALYFFSGRLGLSLAFVNMSTTAVWPPTGIALAAVLLLGPGIWPGIAVGAFSVNLYIALTHDTPWPTALWTSVAIAVGNTLEALVGGLFTTRFARGRRAFDDANDIIKYTFLAALPATAISATLGVLTLTFAHIRGPVPFLTNWITWWLGDYTSALVITPLILIWSNRPFPKPRAEDIAEGAAILSAIFLVGEMIFGGWLGFTLSKYPIEYIGIPMILWSAFRFHQRGAITTAFLMSAIAVRGTLEDLGPFAVGDPNRSLLLLQTFSGIVTITMLVLAAAVRSRVLVEDELRNREHQLRLALSARAESEARAAVVLDAAVDGILTIDERGTIETVNRATEHLFGYKPEEIIGRNIKMLMPSPFADEHDTYLLNYLTTGNKKIIGVGREVLGLRKNGSTFPMDLSVSEVRIDDGRRIFTGIVHDITEHKRAQQEREELLQSEREARSEAERTSRMKDEFLATLSHEMRTPLNAILGYASLLRQTEVDEKEIAEGLEVIDRNARMQARLIEDLLDMSRIISGKVRLDVHPVNLGNVIEAAIETVRPAAEAKRITLSKTLDHVAPISGDAARLQQVLWNLLTNAIKFTPAAGRVDVRLRTVDSHVEITITDTGQGISPEFMPHMFERFRQADASTTRKHGGLGLGLAIVKHLIEMHGGSIAAKSEGEGKGSTFTISLPHSVHPSADLPSSRPESSQDQAHNGKLPSLAGVKLLVVDDEPDARDLMERIFKGCRAKVTSASSVDEALLALSKETPDLLISDIGMPQQDGYDLIRAIRHFKSDRIANLPAIALTAFARSEDRTKALLAGYDAHLAKPTDPLDLANTVSNLLKRSPVA